MAVAPPPRAPDAAGASADGATEEGEPPEKRAKVEEALAENEADAPDDDREPLAAAVGIGSHDCTLNVVATCGGRLLSALSDAGMQHLLAGARADTGVRSGRYMFEVRIVGMFNPVQLQTGPRSAPSVPRQHVRVGFSAAGSSLFLGDAAQGAGFDSEGFFIVDNKRLPVGRRFTRDQVVAVLLNLEDGGPNAHTVSLFVDGVRASPPQRLPPGLRGKALHPHVCFRNVSLEVHLGPEPLVALPFRCRALGRAAAADCAVAAAPAPKDGKFEVLFPVAIPDEGTFDWLDGFLEDHPEFTELSDRAIVNWAIKSGMHATLGNQWNSSNDKPRPGFGVQPLDDMSVRRLVHAAAQLTPRHYVVMEVKANFVKGERTDMLKQFNAPFFRPVAQVMMGEPDMAFKSRVLGGLLKAKQGEALKEEAKDEVKEELEEKEKAEEPPVVELTEQEQKVWFRPATVNDLAATVVDSSFSSFSLPEADEGFSEIRWGWQDEAGSKAHLQKWTRSRKLLVRIEGVRATEPFVAALRQWCGHLKDWQAGQQSWRQQEQAMKELAEETAKDAAPEVEDVTTVDDVTDTGGGRPLFASFQHEDWAVLSLRFELLLLVTSFARDVRDSDHPGLHESLVSFYYAKYFGKPLNASLFGVGSVPDLLELAKDTVAVDRESGCVLVPKLPEDVLRSPGQLVKLAEASRRGRLERLQQGPESGRPSFSGLLPAMEQQQLQQLLQHPLLSEDRAATKQGPRVIPANAGGQAKAWQPGGSWSSGQGTWGQNKGGWGEQKGGWGGQAKGGWQKGGWGPQRSWGDDAPQSEDGGSWGKAGGWASQGPGWQPGLEAAVPKVLAPTTGPWSGSQASWA